MGKRTMPWQVFDAMKLDDSAHLMGVKRHDNPTLGVVDFEENRRLRRNAKRKPFTPSGKVKPVKVAEREPSELPDNGMYVTGRPTPHGNRPKGYIAIGKR